MGFLLFLLGLFIVPAIIGGVVLTFYVIDYTKLRIAQRKVKADIVIAQTKEKLSENTKKDSVVKANTAFSTQKAEMGAVATSTSKSLETATQTSSNASVGAVVNSTNTQAQLNSEVK